MIKKELSLLGILLFTLSFSACGVIDQAVAPSSVETATTSGATLETSSWALTGADRDVHGCIGSAGYQWCAIKNKCLRLFEEDCSSPSLGSPCADKAQMYCPLSGTCGDFMQSNCLAGAKEDFEAIKQVFYKKFSSDESKVSFELFFNDGLFAVAGMNDLPDNVRSGAVYAAKKDGVWQVVAAGRGAILCDDLKPFSDYPAALIPECADGQGGTILR